MAFDTRKWTISAVALTAVVAGSMVAWRAEAATASAIDWKPCAEAAEVDCATITVPLDWSKPEGDTIDIGLARRQATDPDNRIGTILMDPGGPGGSGVEVVKQSEVFTGAVNERFDTVGFDPRGVNTSTPITCDAELVGQALTAMMPETPEQFDRAVKLSGEVAEDCRTRTGPLYDHVDNRQTVEDMEAIRIALGEGKLNYVGYSYGTLMGQQYAQAHPDRIRTMVLDGNMDHSITSTYEQMATQVAATEKIFDAFAKWCDTDADCAINGRGTAKVWGQLRERAKAGELTDPGSGRPVDFATFSGLIPGNAKPTSWVKLGATLKALSDGEGTMTAKAAEAETTMNLPSQAQWCQDWDLPIRDFKQWQKIRTKLARAYPDTQWTSALNKSLQCVGYPGETTNPQARLDIDDAPPLVMLGNTHDPATVYPWTEAAAKQSGAALVTYEGFGHTIYAYGRKSECVNDAVDAYLIDLTVPKDGLRCPEVNKTGATAADYETPVTAGLDWS